MLTLVHSKELSISDIMLQVKKATEFPICVKVGPGMIKIENSEQAEFFSLGILAKIDADWGNEEEDEE